MSTTTSKPELSVLFVCLGNICRSPMAHGVFTSQTSQLASSLPFTIIIDSAGTGGYHTGAEPDSRTLSTLSKHGILNFRHGARKLVVQDFFDFDYILAMDRSNLSDILNLRRRGLQGEASQGKARVVLFGDFGGWKMGEVVGDPYYGEDDGFEIVYEQCVRMSRGLLEDMKERFAMDGRS